MQDTNSAQQLADLVRRDVLRDGGLDRGTTKPAKGRDHTGHDEDGLAPGKEVAERAGDVGQERKAEDPRVDSVCAVVRLHDGHARDAPAVGGGPDAEDVVDGREDDEQRQHADHGDGRDEARALEGAPAHVSGDSEYSRRTVPALMAAPRRIMSVKESASRLMRSRDEVPGPRG